SEDEWEAAARGRGDRRYPWGNEPPRCGDVVIKNDGKIQMSGVCAIGERDEGAAHAVGSALQDVTPEGIHDLGGDGLEWTASPYFLESREARLDSAASNAPRVFRGGSWAISRLVRTSARNFASPRLMGPNIGFRCASDAEDARP